MNKVSYHRSRSGSNQRKPSGKRNHITRENQKKLNQRTRGPKETRER